MVEVESDTKPKKAKFKPDTVVRLFLRDDTESGEEEWDLSLGEKVCGESCLAITPDVVDPKKFQITHNLTGFSLCRGRDLEVVREHAVKFWERCSDTVKDLYRSSGDPNAIFAGTPEDLRRAIKTGKFE